MVKSTFLAVVVFFLFNSIGTFTFGQAGSISSISLDSLLNIEISSASKYDQKTSDAPASITLITSDQIRDYGYDNITELLNSVRGMYISHDRNYDYIGIRGFSRPSDYNNRLLLMIDGHTFNENFWGSSSIGTEIYGINLDMVERVEVIRGPASSLYGNYPMMGIINIVTKKGADLENGFVSVEGGSLGKLQSSLALGKKLNSGLEFSMGLRYGQIAGQDLYYEEYDTPDDNNGIAEMRDYRESIGFVGKMGYKGLSVKAGFISTEIGVPTGVYDVLFNDPRAKTLDQRGYLEVGYQKDIDKSKSIKARVMGDVYNFDGYYPYDPSDGGLAYDEADGAFFTTDVQFNWDLLENNRLLIGTEYVNNFQSSYISGDEDTVYFDANFPFSTLSFYVQDEHQIGNKLNLVLGGRYDYNPRTKTNITPRAAIIYNPFEKTTLKLLYGSAYRAPNTSELFLSDEYFYEGNPDLLPEFVTSLELSVEQRIKDFLTIQSSVYRIQMENLIDPDYTPDDSLIKFFNTGTAEGYGFELGATIRTKTGISGYANYSHQRMVNAATDTVLSNSPGNLFKAGLSIPIIEQFRISPEVRYETSRQTIYGDETDPFLLAHINFVYSPNLKSSTGVAKVLNNSYLSFKVRNILNTVYAHPVGFDFYQDRIQQNGRTFNIKLQVGF